VSRKDQAGRASAKDYVVGRRTLPSGARLHSLTCAIDPSLERRRAPARAAATL